SSRITKYRDHWVEGDKVVIQMERCSETLLAVKDTFVNQSLPLRTWLVGALKGVEFIHKNGIVHNDIKPDNLFAPVECEPLKLGDFGCSINMNCKDSLKKAKPGADKYQAPEWGVGIRPRSDLTKLDIFSLGKTVSVLANGQMPNEISRIVNQMMSKDPNDRPSAAEALKLLAKN
ncbi:MAG: hypothetical protein SGILL_010516, partial [Bacillariaceae sp.]